MSDFRERSKILLGEPALNRLEKSHVAVFGIGGVGGSAAEALVRGGIGELTLVDADTVDITNINRQSFASSTNIGKDKVNAAYERLISINPNVKLHLKKMFFLKENSSEFNFGDYNYVIDAVDTVSAKLALITASKSANTPIISAMGAGNKLDPTKFEVTDIFSTSVCPLAKVMRKELRALNVNSLKVVYSKEEPVSRNRPPGSVSFVPPVCGLIMAGEVIKDISLSS